MIVVAIIGILSAVAIPNFIKFQARSKQSEPKTMMRSIFTLERAFFEEFSQYSSCVRKVGFSPERGNRYHYKVNSTLLTAEADCLTSELRADAAGLPSPTDGAVLVDTFKYPNAAAPAILVKYAPVPPLGSGVVVAADLVGVVPPVGGLLSSFGAGAAGNIDADPETDDWYISSAVSTTAGNCPSLAGKDQNVPGGEPKNVFDDTNCP